MVLEDFLHKHVIVYLKDGGIIEGIVVEINDVDNYEDSIFYTTINIRVDYNDYRLIYINEIDSIGEIN